MQIRWFGQSAFLLSAGGRTVIIDPFGSGEALAARELRFGYPAIAIPAADLLLITHEHFDHNNADAVGGDPHTLRATAGTFDTPLGEVIAIASEHDPVAGTERGPNTIFVFELDGRRVCHLGDFGQGALRDEQRRAIGRPDILFIPVGDGPTIGPQQAVDVLEELRPRLAIPMHYRTEAINFLSPVEPFLERLGDEISVSRAAGATLGDEDTALPETGTAMAIPSPPIEA